MRDAINWSLTSEAPPDDGEQLASELVRATGHPPWISGSIEPTSYGGTLSFVSRIVESALTLVNSQVSARTLRVDDDAMQLLFSHNPGVYEQLTVVVSVMSKRGSSTGTGSQTSDPISARTLFSTGLIRA